MGGGLRRRRQVLRRGDLEEVISLSPCEDTAGRQPAANQEAGSHPTLSWFPDFRFPASGAVRNTFLLFKRPCALLWSKQLELSPWSTRGSSGPWKGREVHMRRDATASLFNPSCAVKTQLHLLTGLRVSRHCAPAPAGGQVAAHGGGGRGTRTGLPDSTGQSAPPTLIARPRAEPRSARPPRHCARRPHSGSAAAVSGRFSPAAGEGPLRA